MIRIGFPGISSGLMIGGPGIRANRRSKTGWTPADIPQDEADGLVDFYDDTDGPNWEDPWDFGDNAGDLPGVTVEDGHVTGIDVSGDNHVNGNGVRFLVALVRLVVLKLHDTLVSGDLNFLKPLVHLTVAHLHNTRLNTYTSVGSLPAWTGLDLKLTNNGLASASVDALLVDLDEGGGEDLAVDISGDNEAPGEDGQAAIENLEVKGAAVYVFRVTYNGNTNDSGTAPVDSSAYESGGTVTVLGNTGSLAKNLKMFDGWNTTADGSGTDYAAAATFEISGDVTLYAKWVSASYTAKSVIIDMADTWGGTSFLELRQVDFYYAGEKILITSGITAYSTSSFGQDYLPSNAFYTSTSKTGYRAGNQYTSYVTSATNQRIICVFTSPITFDSMVINNGHNNGGETNNGAKNVKIYTSTDAITSTTYNEAIANSTLIFDGQLAQHVAADQADDQILDLI